jgi:hypothetical protein
VSIQSIVTAGIAAQAHVDDHGPAERGRFIQDELDGVDEGRAPVGQAELAADHDQVGGGRGPDILARGISVARRRTHDGGTVTELVIQIRRAYREGPGIDHRTIEHLAIAELVGNQGGVGGQ